MNQGAGMYNLILVIYRWFGDHHMVATYKQRPTVVSDVGFKKLLVTRAFY
tara:strand:+ start:70 stop:219 length:150 start_codon:yes stop_codon:yes gene_type:complete